MVLAPAPARSEVIAGVGLGAHDSNVDGRRSPVKRYLNVFYDVQDANR